MLYLYTCTIGMAYQHSTCTLPYPRTMVEYHHGVLVVPIWYSGGWWTQAFTSYHGSVKESGIPETTVVREHVQAVKWLHETVAGRVNARRCNR